jgi:biopolymer transport protein ExbB/biopolymer transport protein TolQ
MFREMTAVGYTVIAVMVLMSIYSLWVMVERWITFNKAKNQSLKLLGALSNLLTKGDYTQAIEVTKKYKGSHLAKVIAAGLLEFEATRRDKRTVNPELAVEAARQGMDRTAMITVAELKENLGVLATIGATAPFVGLFGTVVGIINAFTGMAKGGGGIASVSAGIAEALFTTAGGLLVAIPAVWAYNYFQNRVDRFTVEMSNSGSEMAMYFMKETGVGNEKTVG